jgi:2-polyprenyl-3-methyl-5-hydroxy-6-metoxy-1,4-benzoquinol methylase
MTVRESYSGQRILEAMRNAPRYAAAIYRMMRTVLPAGNLHVLDFGAGDGTFAELLWRDGVRPDCVEPDLVNQVKLISIGLSPVSDISLLDSEQYDFVYTINVLEHLDLLDSHVAQLHRVLKQNGRLFVFVPAFQVLWTSLDDEVQHLRRFTRTSLAQTLISGGLIVDQCRYFDSVGFAAALFIRAIESVVNFRYSPGKIGFFDRVLLPVSLVSDKMLSSILGKNVVAIARKPEMSRV